MKIKLSALVIILGSFLGNAMAQSSNAMAQSILTGDYSNPLTDNATITDFVDYSVWVYPETIPGNLIEVAGFSTPDNGTSLGNGTVFEIDSQTGLQLITDSNYAVTGAYVLNKVIPSQQSFTAIIKVKISNNIDTNPSNPLYLSGFGVLKINQSDLSKSMEQSVIINLEKHKNNGFYNEIGSRIYNGDDTAGNGTVDNDYSVDYETVYLKINYNYNNNTATTYYSIDGVTYKLVKTFDLSIWNIANSDQLGLALYATSMPFQNVNEYVPGSDVTIQPGEIFLNDLSIAYSSSGSTSGQTASNSSQESQKKSKAKKSKSQKKSKAKKSKSQKKSKAKKSKKSK